MTHELVQNYGLFSRMEILRFDEATGEELKSIHLSDYIDHLSSVAPGNVSAYNARRQAFDTNEDCPMFHGVFDYTASSVGGSLAAAKQINLGGSDVCINWAGGMHHAKKGGASGFCYANDIVACIMDLLRHHKRVLYVDIDVHHGDGVEHFFYNTNRVLTASFHQGDGFFPGTGNIHDIGVDRGENYAINVPLRRGIDDNSYLAIFIPVIHNVIYRYQPEVVVMQLGADSVVGDRLGQFNLSNVGHASCLDYVLSFNLPMVVLGGGGYTACNVARTWTLETGTILGQKLSNVLPKNTFMGFPDGKGRLEIPSVDMYNHNSQPFLEDTLRKVLQIIAKTEIAPSVPLHTPPPDWYATPVKGEPDDLNPDVRLPQPLRDTLVDHPNELYDGDSDNDHEGSEPTIKTEGVDGTTKSEDVSTSPDLS